MIRSFITSFKLKNTYRVNSIIYSLKQLPLIKKLLPNSLYQSKGLKVFGNIISSLFELASIFVGKALYVWIMIFLMLSLYKTNSVDTFLHLLFFLTIIGAMLNTFMFNPSKDKYYAIILMNMDAKKYALSNYFYDLLKVVVGFLPFTIIFGSIVGVPLIVNCILPFFVAFFKMIVSAIYLFRYEKTGIALNENVPDKTLWTGVIVLLALAYGLPLIGIVLPSFVTYILIGFVIVIGILSFKKLWSFEHYKNVYRQILSPNNVYVMENSQKMVKENVAKQIEYNQGLTSNKTGFSFFHDTFVKRHRKILTKSAQKQSIVIFIVFVVLIIVLIVRPDFKLNVNNVLLTYLPYFVFIMYILNRGTVVTQAMFMNCDHSMLTYRIYRTPKVILGLFKERLKTLILINLIPAILIAIGLPLVLYITGGTSNSLNYFILFFSIISMSIFFSVHYLVMYYLLQPYNVNTEMKSSTYSVVQMITYFACYFMIQLQLPTLLFGICVILFSIIYSIISLYLAYRLAPKTFRLRL